MIPNKSILVDTVHVLQACEHAEFSPRSNEQWQFVLVRVRNVFYTLIVESQIQIISFPILV